MQPVPQVQPVEAHRRRKKESHLQEGKRKCAIKHDKEC